MIRIKQRWSSFVLAAVMMISALSYSVYEAAAERDGTDSDGFWGEVIADAEQSAIPASSEEVVLLLNSLDESAAVDEIYLNEVLTAGEGYNALPISEKNKVSADSVRVLQREYKRVSLEVVAQADLLPAMGEVCLFADNNEDTIEKVLKLSYYSNRFPYEMQKALPKDKLTQLENKLTRILYADSSMLEKARVLEEFSLEQGTEQVLSALEAYHQLGNDVDLVSGETVEKVSTAVSRMVYDNSSLSNSNFCLMFTVEELSRDTAPTLNVASSKLKLTQKQMNAYKSVLKPNTELQNISRLNVTASGREVAAASVPIGVTIPISSYVANRNPYVIVYDSSSNASILYDTDNNENTITVMMTDLSAEYAVAFDADANTHDSDNSNSNSSSNISSGSSGSAVKIDRDTQAAGTSSLTASSEITSSSESDRNVSAEVSSSDNSSDADSSSSESAASVSSESLSSNAAADKPILLNMPAKLEHNNRFILIISLIGVVALLVGILVIMFIPRGSSESIFTKLLKKIKK